MKRAFGLVALTFVAGLGGCFGYNPPSISPMSRPALPVRASFSKTWNAAIDLMAEASPKVGEVDRSSGLIVATGYLRTSDPDTLWADCGSNANGVVYPTAMSFNIVIHGDSSSATVHANAFWENGPLLIGCVSRGNWEGALEKAIKSRAEGVR